VATLHVCNAKFGTLGGHRTLEGVHSTQPDQKKKPHSLKLRRRKIAQNDKIKRFTNDARGRCVASSQVYFIRLWFLL